MKASLREVGTDHWVICNPSYGKRPRIKGAVERDYGFASCGSTRGPRESPGKTPVERAA